MLSNVNSDYVVQSPKVKNGSDRAGAATWCRGTTNFPIGLVTEQNSLVGANADDYVGLYVTALSNGHYVVTSPVWNGGAGAVTWCDGATGRTGAVSVANSLVGSAMDNVGLKDGYIDNNGDTSYGTCGVIPLPNGHYLVASYGWNNGDYGTQLGNVSYPYGCGAVTWCNGTTGLVGVVSAANSLVGSTQGNWAEYGEPGGDNVGSVGYYGSAGVFVLPTGNYVVASPGWDNGGIDVGAVTWGDGNCGVVGEISAENSLVGSVAGDQVGLYGVCALTNGNYVVPSPNWDNSELTDVGAATWGAGNSGVTGVVSADNSLVGCAAYDMVGGGAYALANGNYVVSSSLNGAGAVTWCDGNLGRTGAVSANNSLVGSAAANIAGVYALAINGNYVVTSPLWDNDLVTDVGAVTWCDGTLGRTGVVSTANSLVGSTAGDQVGNGVCALPNGNYVVASAYWNSKPYVNHDGSTNMYGCGAVTWGSGTLGVTGVVSAANSLVGTHDYDQVGS